MGSRRPRSSLSRGRSSSGEDSNGRSRSTSCSYISNVRPENRSTLCRLMSQLTEDKQPSFETTLKSKAVSEKCNVKFTCVVTGNPTPQLLWYKDDTQLDRFCGLPKYEIFRHGQNHSLHIYNCTLEDAAIYQASASNIKGIVSCSGVLEVGDMNEFRIHQRYFGKIKQKADLKRSEAEGKENREPAEIGDRSPDLNLNKEEEMRSMSPDMKHWRTTSPDRMMGKRRLRDGAVEEKPTVPITNGEVSALTNGQEVGENVDKSGTYIYDSAQKTFTAQQQPQTQSQTHFTKKKSRISSDAKIPKSDSSEDLRTKNETLKAGARSARFQKDSEEVMEVESSSNPSFVDAKSRNLRGQVQKTGTEKVAHVERPSKGENVRVGVTGPSQKDQPSPKLTPTSPAGIDGKKSANVVKRFGITDAKNEKTSMFNQAGRRTTVQKQFQGDSEEVMEVESSSNPSYVDAKSRNVRGQVQKSGTEKVAHYERPSRGDNVRVGVSGPSQKEQSASTSPSLTKTENKKAPVSEKRDRDSPKPPQRTVRERGTSTSPSLSRNKEKEAAINEKTDVNRKTESPKPPQRTAREQSASRSPNSSGIDGRKSTTVAQKVGNEDKPLPKPPQRTVREPSTSPSPSLSRIEGQNVPNVAQKVGIESKQTQIHEKKVANKDTESPKPPQRTVREPSTSPSPSLSRNEGQNVPNIAQKVENEIKQATKDESKVLQKDPEAPTPPARRARERAAKEQSFTVTEVDERSSKSSQMGSKIVQKDAGGSLNAPCESDQKNAPVLRPARRKEVTPPMSRNDKSSDKSSDKSPVSSELQTQSDLQISSQRCVDEVTSSQGGPQTHTDTFTPRTHSHSFGLKSQGSGGNLFTDARGQKEEEKEEEGEQNLNAQESKVPPVKTNAGTEIHIYENAIIRTGESSCVSVQSERGKKKMVGLEIENTDAARNKTDSEEVTSGPRHGDISSSRPPTDERREKNLDQSAIKSNVLEQNEPLESQISQTVIVTEFKEIPKSATKIISIAELLRAQIKALESSIESTLSAIPIQNPTDNTSETCESVGKDGGKLKPEVQMTTPGCDIPLRNLRDTLMEIYNQLYLNDELILTESEGLNPVQAPQTPPVIPPISVVDTCTITDTTKDKDVCVDVCEGTKAKTEVQTKDTGKERVKNIPTVSVSNVSTVGSMPNQSESLPATSREGNTQKSHISGSESAQKSEPQGEDVRLIKDPTLDSQFKSKSDEETSQITFQKTLDRPKVDEQNAKDGSVEIVQKVQAKSEDKDVIETTQKDVSMIEEISNKSSSELSAPSVAIPSATARELASGARRKIPNQKSKSEEVNSEAVISPPVDSDTLSKNEDVSTTSDTVSATPGEVQMSQKTPLLQVPNEESVKGKKEKKEKKRSPLLSRRKVINEAPRVTEETQSCKTTEPKPAEKDKTDPFKAPQVIRKIRGETFNDSSGHMKLWCQFFNVLCDSTITWERDGETVATVTRSAGDESQVNLAIVQSSSRDSGVYGCSINNLYGTDYTDFLLSADVLAGFGVREDLSVGEEMELTPMLFNRGVGDGGVWGGKLFGRIMVTDTRVGDGSDHKVWRSKVIYGLEPLFESGSVCVIKSRNPIPYGGKGDSCLSDRALELAKQECKMQNLAREYCKIFAAESRVIENFGPTLEVIPSHLLYRPANPVAYSSVEAELEGLYQQFSVLDTRGRIISRSQTVCEQKTVCLQHWIYQWTNGNMLFTRMEGVENKITGVGISVKTTGHQGLSVEGNPKVFEYFVTQHQCNYFCGLLSLRSLKESLLAPSKNKTSSRSPLLQRKSEKTSTSANSSPQSVRKAATSPKIPRKNEQKEAAEVS